MGKSFRFLDAFQLWEGHFGNQAFRSSAYQIFVKSI